ncbi:MAG: GNAT family N-acetyltransferase [Ruminococcus sp.]|nr:GNAT family N-acetyltransferase [Ruminococcus sp.]
MKFKHYSNEDYEAVCGFLIELNRENQNHINWNWARFEWMAAHPEFDKSAVAAIGLWMVGEKVAGAAIYDMYFGEAFCAALPEHAALYPDILDYACRALRDENGLGVAVCDDCREEIAALQQAGFVKDEQTETVLSVDLEKAPVAALPGGLHIAALDPVKEPYAFQWLLWQGFDHGTDKAVFEREDPIVPQHRPHLDPRLSLTAVTGSGERVAYCCLWYDERTDYAYVEPLCTVPAYRGKGVAKALLCEALDRAKRLGARRAYVISDLPFYKRLGFGQDKHFTFYWKRTA